VYRTTAAVNMRKERGYSSPLYKPVSHTVNTGIENKQRSYIIYRLIIRHIDAYKYGAIRHFLKHDFTLKNNNRTILKSFLRQVPLINVLVCKNQQNLKSLNVT